MDDDVLKPQLRQGIVGGESAEPGLVRRQEVSIWKFPVQSVKELSGIRMLGERVLVATLGDCRNMPSLQMHVNSNVNVLSFEGKFVPLHNGTVLIVNVCCLFALTKIQSNYYRTNFFCLFLSLSHDNFRLRLFIRNFAPQPDEEAGSAEEQPASNMAVPALEAVLQEPPRPWAAY
jgi:hypothetical protein